MFWLEKEISKVENTLLQWILQNILENQTFQRMAKFIMADFYEMDFMKGIFFLQYNWLQLDKTKNKWKIYYKEITKKETRKYSTSTYLTALSNRTVKKELGGGGRQREKNEYIFKAKETISKQWSWKSICIHYVFNRSL